MATCSLVTFPCVDICVRKVSVFRPPTAMQHRAAAANTCVFVCAMVVVVEEALAWIFRGKTAASTIPSTKQQRSDEWIKDKRQRQDIHQIE